MAVGATTVTAKEESQQVSLYVGDLDGSVTETDLYDVFNEVVQISSVKVCRDHLTGRSRGYAYVNLSHPQDAAKAMKVLNFTVIKGKPIRIMYANQDSTVRKSGHGNVFIKNLESSVDNKLLHDTFSVFGSILSCKVVYDAKGKSRGFGFVQFEREEDAQGAISNLNGTTLNGKQVYVGAFLRRQERPPAKFTNVYLKNLSESTTEEDLDKMCGEYGTITSAVVMRDQNGKSKCFGFVNFKNPEDAALAIEKLNGKAVEDDKLLYAEKAQKKEDREALLRERFEQEKQRKQAELRGRSLYLKNIDDDVNDEKLKDLFSQFGTITSSKVMVNPNGTGRGSGFVAFSSREEATRALTEMNGRMVGKKPLYVAFFQPKEVRKAQMQALFARVQKPSATQQVLPSSMPFYLPETPPLMPQPPYLNQSTLGLVAPQPFGLVFQPPLSRAIRPVIGPNFMMPYLPQMPRQPAYRNRFRPGLDVQHIQQPQQFFQRNHHRQGYGYVIDNQRNGVNPYLPPPAASAFSMPLPSTSPRGMMHVAPPNVQQRRSWSCTLASAAPSQRITMLGGQLYPLVEQLEPGHAAKLTGMLLEMDEPEVLHLIESPDALKQKVAEAMEVLRQSSAPISSA